MVAFALFVISMQFAWESRSVADDSGLLSLGAYERDAVVQVLLERKLQLDPAPSGKKIAHIYVVNLDAFGNDTGRLQVLNRLHRTSRESMVRRELLMRVGDLWTDKRIRESERIIRNPFLSSFVAIVPVITSTVGEVGLLLVTRDVWSLRTNSDFIHQAGRLTFMHIAAAENNLWGTRKHVSLNFTMDQGDYFVAPRWRDANVFGKRWKLEVEPGLIFSRATNELEGSLSSTRLEKPLWSLASQWGSLIVATHRFGLVRNFEGSELARYDNPDTEEAESVEQKFRLREFSVESKIIRSFGNVHKHNFTFGHEIKQTRPSFLQPGALEEATEKAFARDIFPRSERSSALLLGYQFFEPRFISYRNIERYDLPEVRQLGPRVSFDLAIARREIGSENNFVRAEFRPGYQWNIRGNAYADIELHLARRWQNSSLTGSLESVDNSYGLSWFLASPPSLFRHRLIASGATRVVVDPQENVLFRIGGQEDLRGYGVGAFVGTSFYRSTVELRSLPTKVSFLRVGYVLFWDVGDAASRAGDWQVHHDVGFGIKGLMPQFGEALAFLYWAAPLDREADRFPGRFSFGLGSSI